MKDLGTDLASYGGKVDFINGAVPAVGSPFFAACGVDMFVGEVDLMVRLFFLQGRVPPGWPNFYLLSPDT